MSDCNNCYNGCPDIKSDQCIRYTGIDIPILGIESGDSLSYVEQTLIQYLLSTLDGTGIKPDIDPAQLGTLVTSFLLECKDVSIVDLSIALAKAIVSLETDIDGLTSTVNSINASFTVSCLSDVTAESHIHEVVQSIINSLCTLKTNLENLAHDVDVNYVKLDELSSLIDEHIGTGSTLIKDKMVPYVAVEYYGPLSNFDISGAGTGNWIDIYLCNGNHNTPDKRGRIPVGATTGMGGGTFDTTTDPAVAGNPTYVLLSKGGSNNITLSGSQLPSHTHLASVKVTEDGHYHYSFNTSTLNGTNLSASNFPLKGFSTGGNMGYEIVADNATPTIGKTNSTVTGVKVAVDNSTVGENKSHSNIPPVLACYYIIYIP